MPEADMCLKSYIIWYGVCVHECVSNRDEVALQGYADVGLDAGAFLSAASRQAFKAQQR